MKALTLGFCLVMVGVYRVTLAAKKDYSGYEVIRVHATSSSDGMVVGSLLEDKDLKVEMWTELDRETIDLQVPPGSLETVQNILRSNKVKYEVDIRNIQAEINRETAEEEEAEEEEVRKRRDIIHRIKRNDETVDELEANVSFDIVGKYVDWDKMTKWLDEIQQSYPTIVDLISIGTSTEGREMQVVKIGKATGKKPAFWIDANIHAREWITSATANYIIKKLVTEYGSDKTITKLLEHYDWYILPVVNPDGFQYTHTTERLWRKTRSEQSGSECYGVDPNRNWDFKWGECCRYTSLECDNWRDFYGCGSNETCDNVFFGEKPFSEPETANTANFILSKRKDIKLYLSLHSYSQLWLQNWGYTKNKPKDYDELERLTNVGMKALKMVHNTTYIAGSPAQLLYAAAGGSYDWARGVAGIKYSYTLELRDQGQHGFLLPMQQIIPTAEETWAAVQALAQDLMEQ